MGKQRFGHTGHILISPSAENILAVWPATAVGITIVVDYFIARYFLLVFIPIGQHHVRVYFRPKVCRWQMRQDT